VEAVKGMGMEKCVKESGTSYIGNDSNLIATKFHVLESFIKGAGDPFMGATRTKNRRPAGVQ
jgi:hypothetical protein